MKKGSIKEEEGKSKEEERGEIEHFHSLNHSEIKENNELEEQFEKQLEISINEKEKHRKEETKIIIEKEKITDNDSKIKDLEERMKLEIHLVK